MRGASLYYFESFWERSSKKEKPYGLGSKRIISVLVWFGGV